MKSTSGEHYIALDHIRALAALLVFSWHFTHGPNGFPVPFSGSPGWGPLVLFDEGHVGVALFMTLSGYLFAKLLDGKHIVFRWFLWNRFLRLMPLLFLVIVLIAAQEAISANSFGVGFRYLLEARKGFIDPVWPNGGWSITVELHFYLLLPLLLFLLSKSPKWLLLLLLVAVLGRWAYYLLNGQVQTKSYGTIYGRIDQFTLGILAYYARARLIGRHILLIVIIACFVTVYWWFAENGGYYLLPSYPSTSPIWIILPTLEGACFAAVIAWYEGSFKHRPSPISAFFARIGEYSYSIYLLHFFFVFAMAAWIHEHAVDLSNYYVAWAISLVAFLLMVPIGYVSMRFIEAPFLRLRRAYTRPNSAHPEPRRGEVKGTDDDGLGGQTADGAGAVR